MFQVRQKFPQAQMHQGGTTKVKNSTDNRTSVLYLNARSVKSVSKNRNKLHQLKDAVTLGRFDIVAITETWLDSKVNDSELMHPNYSVYRRDRHDILSDKIGGGVALSVNNNISSCRRHDLEPQEEIVVCDVKPNNQSKIMFILAYKPPKGDVSQFICNVSPLLKQLHPTLKTFAYRVILTCEILTGLITRQSLNLVIHFVI